jgi:hypothetical protein
VRGDVFARFAPGAEAFLPGFYPSLFQQDVRYERDGGQFPFRIEHVYPAYTQALADAQQVRSSHDLAILNWAKKIDLHLGCSDGTPAAKVAGQADAYSCVGHGSEYAAVHHSGAVAKMIGHGTRYGHTIGMPVDDPNAHQLVKRHVFGEFTKIS